MTGDERRAVILDAAHREFSRAGFHGASTARIAAAAGCSEPMLYKHFAGKQDLFTAVLEHTSQTIEERFDLLLSIPGSIADNWTMGLPLIYSDPAYADTVRLRMLALSAIDDPMVRETLTSINERLLAWIRKAIQRGKDEGSVHPDVDPEYVHAMWIGIQFSSCYREAMVPGTYAEMLPHAERFIDSLRA